MNNENVPDTVAKPSPVTNDKSPKLPYAAPKLKEYGDIRELTLGNNAGGPDAAVASVTLPLTG